jgi:lipopolysaccharide transport system permease protein
VCLTYSSTMNHSSVSQNESWSSPIETDREGWTTIIEPHKPWYKLDLLGLWQCRELILLFVKRDFVAVYKQTILGPLWFFLTPLFTTLVLTVVFGKIAKIPTDGIPPFLFYLSGTVCWAYFSGCLIETSNTFIANAHIFGKVYFPRLTIPVGVIISNGLKFAIQFGLFLCFLAYFYWKGASVGPTIWVLALPFVVIQMALLSLGCGILVSSMTTRYRDLANVVGFGVQLWMYATPVVYPLSQIPEKYRNLYALNPMVAVVETFRLGFIGSSAVDFRQVIVSAVVTLGILVCGLVMFSRVERTFMDTV